MFDHEQIKVLRREAELHQLDFTRATIAPTNKAFIVTFKPLLIAVSPILDVSTLQDSIHCRSPMEAEGELITGLLKRQRAERQKVRLGRVAGWDSCAICRTPLGAQELAEYRAELAHKEEMVRLQKELSDALQAKAARAKTEGAVSDLAARYGLTTTKTDPAVQEPCKSKPRRVKTQQTEVNSHGI